MRSDMTPDLYPEGQSSFLAASTVGITFCNTAWAFLQRASERICQIVLNAHLRCALASRKILEKADREGQRQSFLIQLLCTPTGSFVGPSVSQRLPV